MTTLIGDYNEKSNTIDNLPQASENQVNPFLYPSESLKQYDEMTTPRDVAGERSLKSIEKEKAASQELTKKLACVTDQEIKELLDVIDTLDLRNAPKDSVLFSQKLPHIALETLRRGLLDPQHGQKQVATILNFWAALQYHQNSSDLETVSVFSSKAEKLMKMTFMHPTEPSIDPFLEGDKFDLFMKKMRSLPPSEQRFLLVPDIQGDDSIDVIAALNGGDPFKASISQATNETGINVFNRLTYQEMPMRIIPSNGMMQAFLDAQYGEDAVEIKPRVYLSTLRHIYDNRLTNTCDMMVPTPDDKGKSRCPSTADGFQAPWYDFPYHDFYHAIATSAVGQTYRKIGIIASDAIRTYAKTAPAEDQKGLGQLAVMMVDMDYPFFLHFFNHLGFSQEGIFWLTINQQILQQKLKYKNHETLKQLGITPPYRVDLISEESELGVFNALYHTFVYEQQGSSELNKESFIEVVTSYKSQLEELLEEDDEENTATLLSRPIVRLGIKLGMIDLTSPGQQPSLDDEHFSYDEVYSVFSS